MKPLLFLHVPKNAGSSMASIFRTIGNDEIQSEHFRNSRAYTTKALIHTKLEYVQPKIIDKYQVFACTRNPWARCVSQYTFTLKLYKNFQESRNLPENPDDLTFEGFLKRRDEYDINEPYQCVNAAWFGGPQIMYTEGFEDRVDFLRTEHLSSDCLAYSGKKPERINTSDVVRKNRDYKEFYTDDLIQFVADRYKRDIDYWGYDFDTSATKNVWAL